MINDTISDEYIRVNVPDILIITSPGIVKHPAPINFWAAHLYTRPATHNKSWWWLQQIKLALHWPIHGRQHHRVARISHQPNTLSRSAMPNSFLKRLKLLWTWRLLPLHRSASVRRQYLRLLACDIYGTPNSQTCWETHFEAYGDDQFDSRLTPCIPFIRENAMYWRKLRVTKTFRLIPSSYVKATP